ncbi:unnamed protein product [Spirodela intermedia]|uniref:Hexosyltransferase n=1 Tax=Spirodela intermedia TaxID=51605 RepID=A0A7I8JH09_SPIIN|nr:unnamed protein product [Spirodela intermedia]CAA6668692.1 unnamed protein product [Spirodela intermedia]
MTWKSRGGGGEVASRNTLSRELTVFLCLGCFFVGLLFSNGIWGVPEPGDVGKPIIAEDGKMHHALVGCNPKDNNTEQDHKDTPKEVSNAHFTVQALDKTISKLEMELAAARAAQDSILNGSPVSEDLSLSESSGRRKYFMVIGINTAFSSRKRRDSVRATWMPQVLLCENRKKLEEEKGVIVRFVIGHSATAGGILDRAIEAEDRMHGDFMRLVSMLKDTLNYQQRRKTYFATAVSMWDAEFYIKVDDDVHVNIGTLRATLSRHLLKPRVYIGCMKSGPVLAQKGVRYHEPEHWKFGESGNKYFRHATGQLYAISKDLATYISVNQHILHRYANEDVSLGSWFIGLDVNHIDERKLCCGTPPGMIASGRPRRAMSVLLLRWSCSGICKSAERIGEVHQRCGEDENVLWSADF